MMSCYSSPEKKKKKDREKGGNGEKEDEDQPCRASPSPSPVLDPNTKLQLIKMLVLPPFISIQGQYDTSPPQ